MLKINSKILIAFLFVLLVLQVGQIYLFFNLKNNDLAIQPTNKSRLIDKPVNKLINKINSDSKIFDLAFAEAQGEIPTPLGQVYAGIIPHHLLVRDKIAAQIEGLKKFNYQNIILIGPNHSNAGTANIQYSLAYWQTPYGEMAPSQRLGEALKQNQEFKNDEKSIANEPSITNLIPFFKKVFPQATILPVTLKADTEFSKIDDLIKIISSNVSQKKTLVMASVDFSHYQPEPVADFHDQKSQSVIENFNLGQVNNLEIDSPPAIYAVLKYLNDNKIFGQQLTFWTNSSKLLNQIDQPSTSHLFYYFYPGQKSDQTILSLLFFGDIMIDRNVYKQIQKNSFDYLLEKLAGEEKRFFVGQDLISANLEGAVTNSGQHYSPVLENDFAFSPKLVKKFKDYNFSYFTIANNHLTDQGERGIKETKDNLTKIGIDFSGCPDSEVGECSSKIIQSDSLKIGLVAFSMVYHPFDLTKAKKLISDLKQQVDLLIINIHWGSEYQHQFSKTQQEIAHQLIEAGGDLVIGHHPHVVQGMEIYQGKPIFYSLGNFIFDQYFSSDTQQGLSLGVLANFDQASKKLQGYKIFFYPFIGESSQVSPMGQIQKEEFLQLFTGWSKLNNEYFLSLKQGLISIDY